MNEGKIHKKGEVEISELLDSFKKKLGEEAGAIGSFIGIVRSSARKEGKVDKLQYESAETAEEELDNIATEIKDEIDGLSEVAIHHLVDDLKPGDEIIYVLAGGNHRSEVFEALPKIMDRVKSEVHIWKKEITEKEDYWVHEVEE